MDNIQKYFVMICFTGYLREMAKMAMAAASEEDKKAFSLTGGKRNPNQDFSNVYYQINRLSMIF